MIIKVKLLPANGISGDRVRVSFYGRYHNGGSLTLPYDFNYLTAFSKVVDILKSLDAQIGEWAHIGDEHIVAVDAPNEEFINKFKQKWEASI